VTCKSSLFCCHGIYILTTLNFYLLLLRYDYEYYFYYYEYYFKLNSDLSILSLLFYAIYVKYHLSMNNKFL